jgi:hypothetical protein
MHKIVLSALAAFAVSQSPAAPKSAIDVTNAELQAVIK